MECYYGDGILFKVVKNGSEESGKNSIFKVISICNDVEVVNEFMDEYYPDVEDISTVLFHISLLTILLNVYLCFISPLIILFVLLLLDIWANHYKKSFIYPGLFYPGLISVGITHGLSMGKVKIRKLFIYIQFFLRKFSYPRHIRI
jgi:hypothetical protein